VEQELILRVDMS